MMFSVRLALLIVVSLSCNFQVEAQKTEAKRTGAFHTNYEKFFLDTLQKLAGQSPIVNEGGAEQALSDDHSNDKLAASTVEELIEAAGFKYELYYSLSKDGYETQIVRLVNPLADRSKLKQPPVMMFHGGLVDPSVYLWANTKQHHPEPWPRTENDGPETSSNRSMAFVLANNGYDVFLIGTRGTYQSRGHTDFNNPHSKEIIDYDLITPSHESRKYWDYCFDDLIKYEVTRQMDKVLEVTGAKKVTFIVQSFSTIWSFGLFSENKEYADKIHQLVSMVPVVNNKGTNKFVPAVRKLVLALPNSIGNILFQGLLLTPAFRKTIVSLSKSVRLRYTLTKGFLSLFFGPSSQFTTLLELPVLGHIFLPVGFKQFKHWTQISKRSGLYKFDYGRKRNLQLYGTAIPPKYDLGKFMVKNWMMISGELDTLSTKESVQQVRNEVGVKPYKDVVVPEYNHVDFFGGEDVDVKVNLPILEYLDEFALPPAESN